MHSTFNVSDNECRTCTNVTLKKLGTLQGVFGAEIDQITGKVVVSHTDEVSREAISEMLSALGYNETKEDDEKPLDYDEPSIWGCTL